MMSSRREGRRKRRVSLTVRRCCMMAGSRLREREEGGKGRERGKEGGEGDKGGRVGEWEGGREKEGGENKQKSL